MKKRGKPAVAVIRVRVDGPDAASIRHGCRVSRNGSQSPPGGGVPPYRRLDDNRRHGIHTHYFSYDPDSVPFLQAWPRMREDAERILDRVEAAGVRLWRDPFEGTLPPDYEVIAVNGTTVDDLDGETLVLAPRWPPGFRRQPSSGDGFCKTGRKPYDVAVAAILLRCHRLLPDEFAIRSDGEWDGEWRYGDRMPTPGLFSARDVVAELFGDNATECPFERN